LLDISTWFNGDFGIADGNYDVKPQFMPKGHDKFENTAMKNRIELAVFKWSD